MEPLASYAAAVRGRRYDMAIYKDRRGFFLRIYDRRARDIVAPVHLDPAIYGYGPDARPWSRPMWRAWLRDGAERLLFRVGIHRFSVAPLTVEQPAAERELAITG